MAATAAKTWAIVGEANSPVPGGRAVLKAGLRGAARQVEELLPLVVLAPPVGLAGVLDVAALLPVVADRREEAGVRVEGRRPEVEVDRLARPGVAEPVEGDAAVGGAVVLAV